jgi:hypothetical protein
LKKYLTFESQTRELVLVFGKGTTFGILAFSQQKQNENRPKSKFYPGDIEEKTF